MRNIKEVLGKPIGRPVITKAMVEANGLHCEDFENTTLNTLWKILNPEYSG